MQWLKIEFEMEHNNCYWIPSSNRSSNCISCTDNIWIVALNDKTSNGPII